MTNYKVPYHAATTVHYTNLEHVIVMLQNSNSVAISNKGHQQSAVVTTRIPLEAKERDVLYMSSTIWRKHWYNFTTVFAA